MIEEITFDNFQEQTASGMSLVILWAPWCASCKVVRPILERISEEFKSVSFNSVNVEEEKALASALSVTSVPSFVLFEDGKVTATIAGFPGETELIEKLNLRKSLL